MSQIEELRRERNVIADSMKGSRPSDEQVAKGKEIKETLSNLEHQFSSIDKEFYELLQLIPNMTSEDVPVGGEEFSVEIKRVGEQNTGARDHLEIANEKGWVDFERGAKVAGTKFYFLKGDLALLENAITQFALDYILKKDFNYMTVPHLVNSKTAAGTGFAPRTSDQSDEYFVEGEDLSLIATAEMPLTGYHADEIIDESNLPLLYAGISPCYRKEAGTYGKDTRGLYRVHQFYKVEQVVICEDSPEISRKFQMELLGNAEDMLKSLELPYRVVAVCTGDMGQGQVFKHDIETWMPSRNAYSETHSCATLHDFQARRLNLKYKDNVGKSRYCHTLNNTLVASPRILIPFLENHQEADGSINVPQCLRPYLGGVVKF